MDKDVPKSTELVKDNLQMGAKAGSESPKMPYKEYTGRVPMAPGFGKRFQFRKTNSATFKLDGMHYTIGMYWNTSTLMLVHQLGPAVKVFGP